MKNIITAFLISLLVISCGRSGNPIVNQSFADSLIANYHTSPAAQTTDSNVVFWQRRMETLPENFVNGPKYASYLITHFHQSGDIKDLLKADSLMKESNKANREKEPGIFRTLSSFAMLQHQFQNADSFIKRASLLDPDNAANIYMGFDVAFELGDYDKAQKLLQSIAKDNSYGYLFRRSKYEHYAGSLDTAINCMTQAAEQAGNNKHLEQVALSNAADLNIHKGHLADAYELYVKSIKIDAADFHSIMGLGWIALVHDKNDTLAEKIFQFVHQRQASPDALLKLEQMAEARNDSVLENKYAAAFEAQATQSDYGRMYNKYLIDLYTGILNNPAKAVALAEGEISSRPTPQAYAWYVWSLFYNGQKDKAYEVFKQYVSNKPLEGLELYYMGKMMKGLNKGYNAQQFFKAAYKNRYDLSPAKVRDLENSLE